MHWFQILTNVIKCLFSYSLIIGQEVHLLVTRQRLLLLIYTRASQLNEVSVPLWDEFCSVLNELLVYIGFAGIVIMNAIATQLLQYPFRRDTLCEAVHIDVTCESS